MEEQEERGRIWKDTTNTCTSYLHVHVQDILYTTGLYFTYFFLILPGKPQEFQSPQDMPITDPERKKRESGREGWREAGNEGGRE